MRKFLWVRTAEHDVDATVSINASKGKNKTSFTLMQIILFSSITELMLKQGKRNHANWQLLWMTAQHKAQITELTLALKSTNCQLGSGIIDNWIVSSNCSVLTSNHHLLCLYEDFEVNIKEGFELYSCNRCWKLTCYYSYVWVCRRDCLHHLSVKSSFFVSYFFFFKLRKNRIWKSQGLSQR